MEKYQTSDKDQSAKEGVYKQRSANHQEESKEQPKKTSDLPTNRRHPYERKNIANANRSQGSDVPAGSHNAYKRKQSGKEATSKEITHTLPTIETNSKKARNSLLKSKVVGYPVDNKTKEKKMQQTPSVEGDRTKTNMASNSKDNSSNPLAAHVKSRPQSGEEAKNLLHTWVKEGRFTSSITKEAMEPTALFPKLLKVHPQSPRFPNTDRIICLSRSRFIESMWSDFAETMKEIGEIVDIPCASELEKLLYRFVDFKKYSFVVDIGTLALDHLLETRKEAIHVQIRQAGAMVPPKEDIHIVKESLTDVAEKITRMEIELDELKNDQSRMVGELKDLELEHEAYLQQEQEIEKSEGELKFLDILSTDCKKKPKPPK